MSISIKVTIAFVALICLSAVKGLAADIRYDGLYRYKEPSKDVSIYLRFYSDGTVISTASTGKPEEVAKWFHRGGDMASGKFVVEGDAVHFEILGVQTRNECAGTIGSSLLMLNCADTDASLFFTFLPMQLAK